MKRQATKPESEAADWLVRLARPVVAQEDLASFRAWRDEPANDEAFRRHQDLWRRAGRLPPDPDLQGALAAARGRRGARISARLGAAWASGVAALVAVAALASFRLLQPESYATAVGERSQIRLADGSLVTLDADSRLTVTLAKNAREVRLTRGQALFDVAHDAGRPFTVTAGDLRVTALGTRFDVRRRPGRDAQVTLLQGRVRVLAGQGTAERRLALDPGQETSTVQPTARAAQVDDAVAWTAGRLVFRGQALAEVVAEVNRYSRHRLRLQPDLRLDRLQVTGAFTAGDTEAVAQALADLYDLRVSADPAGNVVLRPG